VPLRLPTEAQHSVQRGLQAAVQPWTDDLGALKLFFPRQGGRIVEVDPARLHVGPVRRHVDV
jgi:hypothetical protein